jgi:fatty acid-binding protein DegV
MVPNLTYLARGGRIKRFTATIANTLGILTVVNLNDNALEKFGVALTISKAIKMVTADSFSDILTKDRKIKRVGILTNDICDRDFHHQKYYELVMNAFKTQGLNVSDINNSKLPSVIIAHTGPNYIGIAVEVE